MTAGPREGDTWAINVSAYGLDSMTMLPNVRPVVVPGPQPGSVKVRRSHLEKHRNNNEQRRLSLIPKFTAYVKICRKSA